MLIAHRYVVEKIESHKFDSKVWVHPCRTAQLYEAGVQVIDIRRVTIRGSSCYKYDGRATKR